MSNLVAHAKKEMELAGLYKKDSGCYGDMLPTAVMALVEAHSKQGHSGGSHWTTLQVFNKVINFETLTPITSNPDDWFKHDYNVAGENCWQNNRNPSIFSQDGGKTWYDLNDKKKKNWPKNRLTKFEKFKRFFI